MRKYPARWFVVTTTLLLASLSCQLASFESRPEEAGESGRILFQDDFSDPSSGWNRVNTPSGISDYNDGAYRIFVNQAFTDIWSLSGSAFGDAIIEVDTLKVGGPRDNRFGLICRADGDRFYLFVISSDGFYGIGKASGEEYTLIGMESMQPSSAIVQGTALNRLRADCVGQTLALYVNGQLVKLVQDSEFVSGDIGLIVGTYAIPGTDILFDNFVVIEP